MPMNVRMLALGMIVGACGDDPVTPPPVVGCVSTLGARGTACAVRTDGAVFCWGANARGQIGDGIISDNLVPPTRALIDRVATLASGEDTTCAVRDDGTAACWGAGSLGQIGDGAGVDRATPRFLPFANVLEAAASQTHACARLADGTGYCWGDNSVGELGVPISSSKLTPVAAPIGDAVAISTGDFVTCALRADQHVDCWGDNTRGELGDGTMTTTATPVRVAVPDPIVGISSGCHHHSCAVTSLGEVWCWGDNYFGQLGRGTVLTVEPQPAKVVGLTDAVEVSVGVAFTCARTRDGRVSCWGNNDTGQLGDGTFASRATPAPVNSLGSITMIQAACSNLFALRDDGVLFAWGTVSLLGTDETINRAEPRAVPIPCD